MKLLSPARSTFSKMKMIDFYENYVIIKENKNEKDNEAFAQRRYGYGYVDNTFLSCVSQRN